MFASEANGEPRAAEEVRETDWLIVFGVHVRFVDKRK